MDKTRSLYPLRLPVQIKAAVREHSQARGVSMNRFLNSVIAEKLFALEYQAMFHHPRCKAILRRAAELVEQEEAQAQAQKSTGVEPGPIEPAESGDLLH